MNQPLSQPLSPPLNQPLNQPRNQLLSQPFSTPLNQPFNQLSTTIESNFQSIDKPILRVCINNFQTLHLQSAADIEVNPKKVNQKRKMLGQLRRKRINKQMQRGDAAQTGSR